MTLPQKQDPGCFLETGHHQSFRLRVVAFSLGSYEKFGFWTHLV